MCVNRSIMIRLSACVLATLSLAPMATRCALHCRDRVLANVTRVHMEYIGATCMKNPAAADAKRLFVSRVLKTRNVFYNGWGKKIYLFQEDDQAGPHVTVISFAGRDADDMRNEVQQTDLIDKADFVWRDGKWLRCSFDDSSQLPVLSSQLLERR